MASGNRAAPALAALLVGVTLATPARSALPPSWQRFHELQKVLEVAAKALEGHPIDVVERLDTDRFLVRAGPCRLEVRIVDHPRAYPGPRMFDAIPGEPDCS
ncbi:hypothetical protein [Methylobacterium sp. Leaf123]|uniref:hypothetical protein n=1 Tax=Methylobacterium sp. Leaf123 TaxID=1736264 RepID=UPI0009EB6314|nr:hypothetical protein [Methylobacterium sp. Leaf123]